MEEKLDVNFEEVIICHRIVSFMTMMVSKQGIFRRKKESKMKKQYLYICKNERINCIKNMLSFL